MARTREKAKGRKESGSFLAVPKVVLDSEEYAELGAYAVKLLVDIGTQYNGSNNGDLCAAFSIMSKRGWKSKATLHRATKELRENGFIILTLQGGRHKASLYAVSYRAIDECKGKLEVNPTATAPATWKREIRNRAPNAYQCTPYVYQSAGLSTS